MEEQKGRTKKVNQKQKAYCSSLQFGSLHALDWCFGLRCS